MRPLRLLKCFDLKTAKITHCLKLTLDTPAILQERLISNFCYKEYVFSSFFAEEGERWEEVLLDNYGDNPFSNYTTP